MSAKIAPPAAKRRITATVTAAMIAQVTTAKMVITATAKKIVLNALRSLSSCN